MLSIAVGPRIGQGRRAPIGRRGRSPVLSRGATGSIARPRRGPSGFSGRRAVARRRRRAGSRERTRQAVLEEPGVAVGRLDEDPRGAVGPQAAIDGGERGPPLCAARGEIAQEIECWPSRPEAARAMMIDDGPTRGTTAKPRSWASADKAAPGSATQGMPASEMRPMSSPASRGPAGRAALRPSYAHRAAPSHFCGARLVEYAREEAPRGLFALDDESPQLSHSLDRDGGQGRLGEASPDRGDWGRGTRSRGRPMATSRAGRGAVDERPELQGQAFGRMAARAL